MDTNTETLEFERNLVAKLEEKFPGIGNEWSDLSNKFGPELFRLFKSQIDENILKIEGIGELHLSVVIDTNFIFGQIKTAVEKNKSIEDSFIYRLINSTFISIYTPPKLEKELFEKISKIIEDKTSIAESYATSLLEKITIEDAFWVGDWKRAKNMIGDIDEDDVPFLALALHTKSDAIISFDKVFNRQNVSQAWGIKDTEDVIHIYNHGIVSFALFGTGVYSIKVFYELIAFILRVLTEVVKELILGISMLFSLVFNSVSKVRPEVIISMVAMLIGGLLISENLRDKGKEVASKAMEKIQLFLDDLANFLEDLKSLISDLWEAFKPLGFTTLEILAYLSFKVWLMNQKVTELEVEKAKN